MANSRKPLIPPGTVTAPDTSLVESIINRDRAQTGRVRVEEATEKPADNIASNIASNTDLSEMAPSVAASQVPNVRPSAIVGSRPRAHMTTITVRIPTELNQWIAEVVHERRDERISKQDVIISALRLLRDHEEPS